MMRDKMRPAILAGLFALAAAMPGAVRAASGHGAQADGRAADWTLLAVACVTLVVGRTVVHRRARPGKAPRKSH
jgi:hypothetical protein